MATVISYGAAETVTGSCHLLELENKKRIMIDCGMFQGGNEDQNYDAFGFDARSVDYLLVTHAHLDHVGRIPKLLKEGFEGMLVATEATLDLAEVILLDSAKIMREDYETAYKKAQRRGKEAEVREPLYSVEDVEATFELSRRQPKYDETFELAKDINVTYRDAGHILGSAFIEIEYEEHSHPRTIVFSGDIGNDNDMVLPKLTTCKKADYLYVESTYGDRNHESGSESTERFKKIIIDTMKDWGNVLIPSFAVERTQEILCILKEMHERDELPECRIFLDSPMASRATEIYKIHSDLLSQECQEIKRREGTVFDFKQLEYTLTPDESRAINEVERRAIIIAGSGMCTGGRIQHHLKHRLWNRKNAVIFVGYQAFGTMGRHIINGAQWVRIYHEEIRIKAAIHTINGFSAHADQKGIIEWISKMEGLQRLFLVHGEKDKQEVLRDVIHTQLHRKAHIVTPEEIISL